MSSIAIPKIIPAQLSFLAIYNPLLGGSDETFHEQIVFYYSKAAKAQSKLDSSKHAQAEEELREQENEKLRQVGLAQGMVGFARSFSNGTAVDSVETQKSRIVLHELEEDWWILASIDLTQLPAHDPSATDENGNKSSGYNVEYSSREVSPPALLLQQLKRAHNVFLLHHGACLAAQFKKYERRKFCGILDRYWSFFASNWDVLLHGSPAVDIYGGMKLAAGGELGMGVGEEEWGSGERLVFEDFVQRTDGMVDFMVSRFGEPSPLQSPKLATKSKDELDDSRMEPWLGSGKNPTAPDGIVFSGVGAVSQHSLRDLSHWIESIYYFGEHAYGVRDSPTNDRRRQRRKSRKPSIAHPAPPSGRRPRSVVGKAAQAPKQNVSGLPPAIPPPIVKAVESSLDKAVESSLDKASNAVEAANGGDLPRAGPFPASLGDTETWMKYMTLGYGTAWGAKSSANENNQATQEPVSAKEEVLDPPMRFVEPRPDVDKTAEKLKTQVRQENLGYFVIGLQGSMEDEDPDDENDEGSWNNRTIIRTVHVELASDASSDTPEDLTPTWEKELSLNSPPTSKLSRLQPVVYVHRPFIYTFLFRHRTEALNLASFYRNLHAYFFPLHRPLSNSTSPERITARLLAAYNPHTTSSGSASTDASVQPIYDLVYDPRTTTVHSSIPDIPEIGSLIAEGLGGDALAPGWTRVEALNVHSQIIATVASARRSRSEIERTCKTSRGWWVVWMRLPPSQAKPSQDPDAEGQDFDTNQLREAFLVRQARDAAASSAKSSGSRFASGMWRPAGEKTGGAAAGWGPKGLADGIGIDARRYVESLLSLNR